MKTLLCLCAMLAATLALSLPWCYPATMARVFSDAHILFALQLLRVSLDAMTPFLWGFFIMSMILMIAQASR